MTDKKKTLLWHIENEANAACFQPLIDRLVTEGNSALLVLRNDSLSESDGIFKTITSLNLIDEGSSICQRLKQEKPNMSELEVQHFMPKSYERYCDIFIRTMLTCLFSTNAARAEDCARYGITTLGSPLEIL